MKKLVLINFDDQYINTSKIIYDILNDYLKSKYQNFEFTIDDVKCDLYKPLELLVNDICDDIGVEYITDYSFIYKEFDRRVIEEAILSNGLQSFILFCKEKNIEVIVMSNKPIDSVSRCVKQFTPYIENVVAYKYPYDGEKMIDKIVKDRNIEFDDLLIISDTDFNNEYLKYYEYSLVYCGDNIFNDYENIIDLLYGEEMIYPEIDVSLDIEVSNENENQVKKILDSIFDNIEIIPNYQNTKKIFILNSIERKCIQSEENSMYLDNIIEECLGNVYDNEAVLDMLNNQFNCSLYLSIAIYFDNSKVNPEISPSRKTIEFLAKNKIQLNYSTYC
jgi:hypothetical protein